MYKDVIWLCREVKTGADADGYPITKMRKIKVFANQKSAGTAEFYAALQNGIRMSAVFEVFCMDYDGQETVEHGGKTYKVQRTYSKGEDRLELHCSEVV
ncbi:phage head closure protein [Massilioclostridium coli]|uniref:phage head closure protein n=1 Tax=Massilioclostridium coli TaxID=1870991 RepID=UPI00085C173A|nr:phage head closure protein [Massilioclostridium coli]